MSRPSSRKTKCEIALSVFAVLIVGFLPSCTAPGGAPSSAAKPVEESMEGLAQLFQKECIDQQDLDWVRDEIERRRWSECLGAGNNSDCVQNAALTISWTVKTTSKSQISVALMPPHLGDVPGPGGSQCEIDVPEKIGVVLHSAVSRLKIENGPLAAYQETIKSPFERTWSWRLSNEPSSKPRIMLVHVRRLDEYKDYLASQKPAGRADPEIWSFYKRDQERPWKLFYFPQ